MASDPVDTLEQQNGGEHGCLSPPVAPIIECTDPESRLVAYIQKRLDDVPLPCPECCIYRVPKSLRKINEAAYTPQFVSIGPFHHGKGKLKAQETLKWQHLRWFVDRNPNVTLSQYVKTIKGIEETIRKCYAEIISFSSDELVRIMVVDGCFILEYMFRRLIDEYQRSDNTWILNAVERDLTLLENQLPLLVLKNLHEVNGGGNFPDFTWLIRAFSIGFANTGEEEELREKSKGKRSQLKLELANRPADFTRVVDMRETSSFSALYRHLLDFVRDCFKPSSSSTDSTGFGSSPAQGVVRCTLNKCVRLPRRLKGMPLSKPPPPRRRGSESTNASLSENKELHQRPHNVTALYKRGVKFEVRRDGKCLLDISFKNGVFAIPCIHIYDHTESLFRNMIAFEQLHCTTRKKASRYITDYAYLLDSLIDTSKDVELLHDRGIIKSWLGDHEEVSLLFNKLVKEVTVDNDDKYSFYGLCKELNAYHRLWHEWVADLKQTYFNSPWTAISVIAAAVLIVLTILQTIYTIK